jgi:undecaprenyl-diphosphatase
MTGIFIAVGFVFLLFEELVRRGKIRPEKPLSDLTYKNAIIIGLAQCLAFFPGVSRAGAVILVMMVLGFRRDESAAFSFLIAIPTILAAGGYDLFKSREFLLNSISLLPVLAAGFITAFTVAYLAVKWFIRYLQRHTLNLFGFYRLLAGAALLLLLLLT